MGASMDSLRFMEGCIERYAEVAWRTAYVSLRNASDADDLLQQAFLIAWRKAGSAPQERAWPWLAGIIVNEARNFRRREALRRGPNIDEIPEPAETTPDKVEQAELAALVQLALSELSFENRIAIVLTHLAGLSQKEAADTLGISLGSLKTRLREGLNAMLEIIGDRAPDLSATLRNLPIAAPPYGLAAAKAAWVGTLGGSVSLPVVGAAAKITAACLWGAAAAVLVTVMLLAQPAAVVEGPVEVASSNAQTIPAAARLPLQLEPLVVPTRETPPSPPPEQPPAPTPTYFPPVAPPPAEPPPEAADEAQPAPAAWLEPSFKLPRDFGPNHDYLTAPGTSGHVSSVGSDTLSNLMTLWVEAFRREYPNVTFTVESKGSSTAPAALIDGTAQLGPMSREMKESEIQKFEEKFGYKPTKIAVAIDALALFVHKDNPVEKLSLPEIDAIFSTGRKGGYESDITSWSQLRLSGEWDGANITCYGRNSVSAAYGFFKEQALHKGDFKKTVKDQPGSAAVVQAVSVDRNGIGYSGLGARTAGVRAVPVSGKADGTAFGPTAENCHSGDYPLSRYLYIYFNLPPGGELPPIVREFLRFIHSKQGQEIVEKDGFVPLSQDIVEKLGLPYE
jgi:phosphate transport system substrate-binding protein